MRTLLIIRAFLILSFFLVQLSSVSVAQIRSLEQDSTLNNLIHSSDIKTTDWDELGGVLKMGSGPDTMIFIPGLGFGAETYKEFLEVYKNDYTIYAVTLPGFGGSDPLPIQKQKMDFAQTPWINSAVKGIENLIQRENIEQSLLIAHWSVATQIALKLAIKHRDKFENLVLISGVAKSYFESTPEMFSWSLKQREEYVNLLSNRWFNTVTEKTWYDNNYMSYDYAVNPMRGLFLWRQSAKASLTVQIRYILEFYSMDITHELNNLTVPTLIVQPGFNDDNFYLDPERPNYMKNLTLDSWKGVEHELITFRKIDHTRLFLMYDKPKELKSVIQTFVGKDEN